MSEIFIANELQASPDKLKRHSVAPDTNLKAFAEEHRLEGYLLNIGGGESDFILDKNWGEHEVGNDCLVLFVKVPEGGDSDIIGFIVSIAVLSFAPMLAPMIFGSSSALAVGLTTIGLQAAASALLPAPEAPRPQRIPEPSTQYSARVQNNIARLGEPVPIQFGRVPNGIPDADGPEYFEYIDGDQYVNIRYCHGMGAYQFHGYYYNNTDVGDIPDSQLEVINPGETGTLIPANVYPALDVPGGDASTSWSASAISTPKGETADRLGLDVGLLNGLVKFKDNGDLQDYTVTFEWRYRLVNDTNTPIGSWQPLHAVSLTEQTIDPIRKSYTVNATKGRHEVQFRVTALPPDDDNRRKLRYKVSWAGLRGINDDHVVLNDRTLINVRLRITEGSSRLIGDTLKKFRVDSTALNSEWDGSTWHDNVASRSIAWAFAKAYSSAYMGKRDVNRLWIDDLAGLHSKLEGLNHHFDYRFDQSLSLQEGLNFIARYGRCVPIPYSGTYMLIRDEPQQVHTHIFHADNCRNFTLDAEFQTDDAYDHVVVIYSDPVSGQPTRATFAPVGSAKDRPVELPFLGCSSKQHASSEAEHYYYANKTFLTANLENRNLKKPITFGSKVLVPDKSRTTRAWGYIKERSNNDLTLSKPHGITGAASLSFDDGYHDVVALDITSVINDYKVTVNAIPGDLDIIGSLDKKRATSYLLSDVSIQPRSMRVRSIGGEDKDGWRPVHLVADSVPEPNAPADNAAPSREPGEILTITNLSINQIPDGRKYTLDCAVNAVADADSYICQINTSSGAWRTVYSGVEPQWVFSANRGVLQIRVAAIGSAQGAWYIKTITVGDREEDVVSLPPPNEVAGYFTPGGDLVLNAGQVQGAKAYQWAIYDTDTLTLRYSIDSGDKFTFTLQQATENGGPWRRVTVRVFALDANNNGSLTFAEGAFVDAQIGGPTNISVTGFTETIGINWTTPAGAFSTLIYASQVNGFVPSVFNFKIEAFGNQASFKVPHDSEWYIRLASRDYLGADDLNFSDQYYVKANLLSVADFDGQLPSDKVVGLLDAMQDIIDSQNQIDTDKQLLLQAIADIQTGDNERSALQQVTSSLGVSVSNNTSSINQLSVTLATETQAMAGDITDLEVSTASNASAINQANIAISNETQARVSADQTLTAANQTSSSEIQNAQTAITDESNTRATQFASLTSSIGNTDQNVASAQQSLATQANAITGLESRYVLKVQAGTQFGGVIIQATEKADGTGSTDIAFLGSTFKVVSTVNGAPITPFKISGNTIGMDGNVVLQGTLEADKLDIDSLSSISADIGTVTAGKIQSPNGHRLISMTQSDTTGTFIRSQDANGVNQFYVLNNGLAYCKNLTAQGNIEASTLKANVAMVNTLNVASQAITQITGIRNRAEVLPFQYSWGGGELVFSKVFPSGVSSDPIIHFGALLEHHYDFGNDGGQDTESYIYSRLLVNGVEQFSIPQPQYRFGAHIPLSFSIQLPLIGFTTIKLQFRRSNNSYASKASERFIRVEEFLR